jgi:hypothetical protein
MGIRVTSLDRTPRRITPAMSARRDFRQTQKTAPNAPAAPTKSVAPAPRFRVSRYNPNMMPTYSGASQTVLNSSK